MSSLNEGLIIQDEETLGDFIEVLASIDTRTPFRVRLVSMQDDAATRICAISLGERHFLAGPKACRVVADILENDVDMRCVASIAGPDLYTSDASGLIACLRDTADRLEVKRLN